MVGRRMRLALGRRPRRAAAVVMLVALAVLGLAGCADATVTVVGGSSTTPGSTPGSTATATAPAPTATPDPSRYDGTWVDNVTPANGQAGELVITNLGGTASVHGFAPCGAKCDWGSASSAVGAFNLVVNFSLNSTESATLTIQLSSNNLKVVEADTHFGTSTYFMHQANTTEARAFLYLGEWVNNNASTTTIPEIYIYGFGTALTIHAYGACKPAYCDWQTRNATFSADPLVVPFDNINSTSISHTLSLSLLDSAGTTLQCVMDGTYTDTFHRSLIS